MKGGNYDNDKICYHDSGFDVLLCWLLNIYVYNLISTNNYERFVVEFSCRQGQETNNPAEETDIASWT